MSKLGTDGKPIYNDKGKVMKGPNYFKPDLSKFAVIKDNYLDIAWDRVGIIIYMLDKYVF